MDKENKVGKNIKSEKEDSISSQESIADKINTTQDNIEELKKEIEDLKDLRLRALAELENSKKRFLKEKEDVALYAKVDLMRNILPLLDHFENAMQILPEEKDDFEKGIEIIYKEMQNILEKFGLVKIEITAGDDFDPFQQEAVGHIEDSNIGENKVIETLRPGYKLDEVLIRPAWVKVSKGKKEVEREIDELSKDNDIDKDINE